MEERKRKRKSFVWFILLAALIILAAFGWPRLKGLILIKKVPYPVWQKGLCYVSWSNVGYLKFSSDESLKKLANTGTQWVALYTAYFQDTVNSTNIYSTKQTPTDESLAHVINTIHNLGIKVMLKPHLDILKKEGGSWRGDIYFETDPQWEAWFKEYTDFITHYAKLAEENNVEMFCIGTELTTPAVLRGDLWRNMVIKEVRKVYHGPLTYAANWHEEWIDIRFWDALDYVGIDAYFPLSEKDKPTLAELKEGWQKWLDQMERWQARVDKPVIFPEVGYHSALGAARKPWEHYATGPVDLELQRDCYQALLETFWDKDWFYGVYWWWWEDRPDAGGSTDRGFTPQNKLAQKLVGNWYVKPLPKRDTTRYTKGQEKK